jgi:hypothetical protein
MEWKHAVIDWLTLEEGGRKVPPTGEEPPIYWAVIKLIGDKIEPQPNSWSLSVRMLESENSGYRWKAGIQLRVDAAPRHLLVDGVRFELYEGAKKVGTGCVVGQ